MNNHTSQDRKFLDQTQAALPTQWSKPQLTATPLHQALSGGKGSVDATNGGGSPISNS